MGVDGGAVFYIFRPRHWKRMHPVLHGQKLEGKCWAERSLLRFSKCKGKCKIPGRINSII